MGKHMFHSYKFYVLLYLDHVKVQNLTFNTYFEQDEYRCGA